MVAEIEKASDPDGVYSRRNDAPTTLASEISLTELLESVNFTFMRYCLKKKVQRCSKPGGVDNNVESGNAILSLNNILQKIIDVKNGRISAKEAAHKFAKADEKQIFYAFGKEKIGNKR